MALLPVQIVPNPVFTPASASPGDAYANSGAESMLLFLPGIRTMTIRSPHAEHADYSIVYTDASIIVPGFDPVWWNDKPGLVTVEFDDPDGVGIAVIRRSIIGADPAAAPLASLF